MHCKRPQRTHHTNNNATLQRIRLSYSEYDVTQCTKTWSMCIFMKRAQEKLLAIFKNSTIRCAKKTTKWHLDVYWFVFFFVVFFRRRCHWAVLGSVSFHRHWKEIFFSFVLPFAQRPRQMFVCVYTFYPHVDSWNHFKCYFDSAIAKRPGKMFPFCSLFICWSFVWIQNTENQQNDTSITNMRSTIRRQRLDWSECSI